MNKMNALGRHEKPGTEREGIGFWCWIRCGRDNSKRLKANCKGLEGAGVLCNNLNAKVSGCFQETKTGNVGWCIIDLLVVCARKIIQKIKRRPLLRTKPDTLHSENENIIGTFIF